MNCNPLFFNDNDYKIAIKITIDCLAFMICFSIKNEGIRLRWDWQLSIYNFSWHNMMTNDESNIFMWVGLYETINKNIETKHGKTIQGTV